jgi:hypothetical protein
MSSMEHGKIIDDLGGSSAVAQMCGVTVGAISQWRHNGIPRPWLMYLQLLRPDVVMSKAKPGKESQ